MVTITFFPLSIYLLFSSALSLLPGSFHVLFILIPIYCYTLPGKSYYVSFLVKPQLKRYAFQSIHRRVDKCPSVKCSWFGLPILDPLVSSIGLHLRHPFALVFWCYSFDKTVPFAYSPLNVCLFAPSAEMPVLHEDPPIISNLTSKHHSSTFQPDMSSHVFGSHSSFLSPSKHWIFIGFKNNL